MNTLPLLAPDEPSPVLVENEAGRSPFVIVCDHASRTLPRSLGDLGLSEAELCSHIAWDIGAADVARLMAQELDAALFLQQYSRLVIDCNRPLTAPDSIPEVTGGIVVPGNQALTPELKEERRRAIFQPYHECVAAALAKRGPTRPYILITLHSFTPELYGTVRPFHAGVLYNADRRFALPVLEQLRADRSLVVGDNAPYAADEKTDYAIIEYAEKGGHPYVEMEVRQDLITEAAGQQAWAQRLVQVMRAAQRSLSI